MIKIVVDWLADVQPRDVVALAGKHAVTVELTGRPQGNLELTVVGEPDAVEAWLRDVYGADDEWVAALTAAS